MSNFSIDARQFSSVNKKIVSHSPPHSLLPSVLLRAHTHTHIHTHTTTCTHTTLTPHMYTHTSGTHVHTHHTQDISFLNGLFVTKAGVNIWGKKERKKKKRKINPRTPALYSYKTAYPCIQPLSFKFQI